ncbi:hypothetical protein MOQ_007099 [Trypanosoma cruzi marinkellei]|uniref:PH-like domain-containing protein n=1 Tax=Trypanosoma cruzi marinkellei TaxID=85056 RepID=K2M2I1_TRYCR|nr:hypothetical protein MOQ_007099 [Trypanosoma cruzi marinkellei]
MVNVASMASYSIGKEKAFKRLLRATGVNPGNAFVPSRCCTRARRGELNVADNAWCNYSVSSRDTLATCEVETAHHFGPHSSALLCVRVCPATPGRAFPTSCVISLSTSSQRMDELAIQDVVVKEWKMDTVRHLDAEVMETTIAVKTLYHIASLLGKEPIFGTRVFLTFRFLGCCDTSNTHRIAAVELFYTSLRPLGAVTASPHAPHDANTFAPVEVELTLSPTPLQMDAEFSDERAASNSSSDSPFNVRHPVKRIFVVDTNESSVDGDVVPLPPPTPPSVRAKRGAFITTGGVANDQAEDGDGSYASSEDCVLTAFRLQNTPSSPRRRSVTQPCRTIFVDIEKEEEEESGASDEFIEVPTSPCTTLSTSLHRSGGPFASGQRPVMDAPVTPHSPVSSASFNRLYRDEDNAPKRKAPAIPNSTNFEGDLSIQPLRECQYRDVNMRTPDCVPVAVKESVAPPCRAAFVVPDRRDFVPVSFLQQQKKQEDQRNSYTRVVSMPWGEQVTTPAFVSYGIKGNTAAVAKNRRCIRNLQTVPVYEEEQDLLKTVTDLLGLERETLCRGSSSRCTSTTTGRLFPTQSNVCSRQPSPSPRFGKGSREEATQKLESPDVVEPTPPEEENAAVPVVENATISREMLQTSSRFSIDPAASVAHALHVARGKALAADKPKMFQTLPEEGCTQPIDLSAEEKIQLGKPGEVSHTMRQPLADRTSDLNPCRKEEKAAARGETPREPQPVLASKFVSHDTSIPSSEESDEPSLLVQVEHPALPCPVMCWGDSIGIDPIDGTTELAVTGPYIGTFLVWKHHFSRNGTAKRILTLLREGDAVVFTLKKLDQRKKISQTTLRENVAVITGLQAYHSNAIHKDHVHQAECCLVVTRGGQQVAAVEMQSMSELRLAAQILVSASKQGST